MPSGINNQIKCPQKVGLVRLHQVRVTVSSLESRLGAVIISLSVGIQSIATGKDGETAGPSWRHHMTTTALRIMIETETHSQLRVCHMKP